MTPERWQQVKSTLAAALELPDPEARTAFLTTTCADDTALRREVLSLLEQPEQDPFEAVGQVIGVAHGESFAANQTGRIVGNYELVRELARGGMGTVWLARRADRHFEKTVAIKLLKRGTDTDEVLRRFEAERQILARLDHPNIARLLDGGTTDDGLPYFVMEYVDGVPITDFCTAHKLSIEQRLRMFLKVCDAVRFAHQNLIVHRDLKPTNILVPANGEPRLLDFGIAKLLEGDDAAAFVTSVSQQRLTPAYASPEQVRGEPIITVSDVYSLGALLYELLSGETAHRFTTPTPPPTELWRVVIEQEPIAPSAAARDASIKRALRGDLDNIVLKALRKEPQRRYGGVGALAEDIRRYLDDRPVHARKDTLAYRAGKFLKRNKVGVAAAALVVLALAAGAITTAWQARVARRRFNDVRALAHSVLFDYHDAIADLPGSTPVRERLVKDALRYLDNLMRDAAGDRALQREIAAAYEKVGDVQGRPNFANLGDTAGAVLSYRKSLSLREQLAAARPEDIDLQLELAGTYTRLGELLRNNGDLKGAVENNRKAVGVMEKAASRSTSPETGEALALAYATLGDVLGNPYTVNLGDTQGALQSYRRSLEIREKLMANDPANKERRKWVAISYERLGNIHQALNENGKALEDYRHALAINDQLHSEDPTNAFFQRLAGLDYQFVSIVLADMGQLDEAREFQKKNIAVFEGMVQADPNNAVTQSDLSVGYARMGTLLAKMNDPANARTYYDKARAMIQGLLAKDPKNVMHLVNLRGNYLKTADLLLSTGDASGAMKYAESELSLDDQILALNGASADSHRNQALAHAQLARAYVLLAGNPQTEITQQHENRRAAVAEYQKSLAIWEEMRRTATLSKADAGKPEEVARELANCDASIRR